MRGLINLGNTCYFNAALQCLLHIPRISNHFTATPYDGECEFTKLYSSLVAEYWRASENPKALRTEPLVRAFQGHFKRFTDDEEHDAQEAVLCIIDILERAVPEIKPWFYGTMRKETIYPGGKTTSDEIFSVHILCAKGNDIKSMLEESVKHNVLTDFEDDSGEKHHCATTRQVFAEIPPIFMISFDKKVLVDIVERIQVGDETFRLVSSAMHAGAQMRRGSAGHYTAMAKHKGTWSLFDDESVTELSEMLSRAGHSLLVYIKI